MKFLVLITFLISLIDSKKQQSKNYFKKHSISNSRRQLQIKSNQINPLLLRILKNSHNFFFYKSMRMCEQSITINKPQGKRMVQNANPNTPRFSKIGGRQSTHG
jgi:hypothetical protein